MYQGKPLTWWLTPNDPTSEAQLPRGFKAAVAGLLAAHPGTRHTALQARDAMLQLAHACSHRNKRR